MSLKPPSFAARSFALARHSRRIRFLKMILPLIAVAILSSLFLFSRSFTMSGALPFADVDIEDRLREPKITDVRIATTADNGALVDLAAAKIVPKETGDAAAKLVTGKITAPSGDITDMTAAAIDYSEASATAAMTGGCRSIRAAM